MYVPVSVESSSEKLTENCIKLTDYETESLSF